MSSEESDEEPKKKKNTKASKTKSFLDSIVDEKEGEKEDWYNKMRNDGLDLNNPYVFADLLRITRKKYGSGDNSKFPIHFKGKEIATLKHPGHGHTHLYSYSTEKGQQNPEGAAWKVIGSKLAQFDMETGKRIVTIILKYLRMANKPENVAKERMKEIREEMGKLPTKGGALELIGLMLGAVACEAGRGHIGFLHVLTALNRIKHRNSSSNEKFKKFITEKIFPDYDLTDYDKNYMSGTVGMGSEKTIKAASTKGSKGLKELIGTKKGKIGNNEVNFSKRNIEDYQYKVDRDINYIHKWESENSSKNQQEGESDEGFKRRKFKSKVTDHFEAARNFHKKNENEPIQQGASSSSSTTTTTTSTTTTPTNNNSANIKPVVDTKTRTTTTQYEDDSDDEYRSENSSVVDDKSQEKQDKKVKQTKADPASKDISQDNDKKTGQLKRQLSNPEEIDQPLTKKKKTANNPTMSINKEKFKKLQKLYQKSIDSFGSEDRDDYTRLTETYLELCPDDNALIKKGEGWGGDQKKVLDGIWEYIENMSSTFQQDTDTPSSMEKNDAAKKNSSSSSNTDSTIRMMQAMRSTSAQFKIPKNEIAKAKDLIAEFNEDNDKSLIPQLKEAADKLQQKIIAANSSSSSSSSSNSIDMDKYKKVLGEVNEIIDAYSTKDEKDNNDDGMQVDVAEEDVDEAIQENEEVQKNNVNEESEEGEGNTFNGKGGPSV